MAQTWIQRTPWVLAEEVTLAFRGLQANLHQRCAPLHLSWARAASLHWQVSLRKDCMPASLMACVTCNCSAGCGVQSSLCLHTAAVQVAAAL